MLRAPQRVRAEPGRQTLLVHFQAEISALFHFHNDTFVIFTAPFGCVQRRHNKIPVGATLGYRPPPQLFSRGGDRPHGVGAYAPIHTADADATQFDRCVASASTMCSWL